MSAVAATLPARAGARYEWRARQLLRRYLVAYGPWYAAAETRHRRTGFDVEKLIAELLDGRTPGPEARQAIDALTAQLDAEWSRRADALPSPWRRYHELCRALELSRAEADAVLVLLAPMLDGPFGWFLRLTAGAPPPAALPVELLRQLLDPLGDEPEATEAALAAGGRLVRAGLVVPAEPAALRLGPGVASLLIGAGDAPGRLRRVSIARCRELAGRAEALAAAGAGLATALAASRVVLLLAEPDGGARWLAAAAAAARDGELIEVSASELAADPSRIGEVAVRRAGCFCDARFAETSSPADLARAAAALERIAALPLPFLIVALPATFAATALASLVDRLGAPVVRLGEPTAADRERCWRAALARRGPGLAGDVTGWPARLRVYRLPVETLDGLLAAAIAREPDDVLGALEAIGEEAAGHDLGARLPRLRLPAALVSAAVPDDVRRRVDELARRRRRASGRALAIAVLESGRAELPEVAAWLAHDLGVELFHVTGAGLRARPPGAVAGWLLEVLADAGRAGVGLLFTDLAEAVAQVDGLARTLALGLEAHAGVVLLGAEDAAALERALVGSGLGLPVPDAGGAGGVP
jgi:hypothetical protein